MQFRQLLITGSAIVLGCLLSLILFIAILAYSHEHWLPSVVNNVFFSEPLADFPADSFRLESVQLKSWQRLKQLSLSGPENSTLTVEGVSWPLSGRLVLDRLDIRLPDQLPASKDNSQSAGASKTVIVGTVSPTPHDAVTEASPLSGWLEGELSLRPEYQQFYQQLDAVFVQLEAFRQQHQLHTLTIRSMNIQGLPLNSTISLQYFRGDPGSEEDTAYWQLNLLSKEPMPERENSDRFLFDLRGQLSPSQHKLDITLQHAGQFNQNRLALPSWLPVRKWLRRAKQSLEQSSIEIHKPDIKLVLLTKPTRADLALRLPAFEYLAAERCGLSFSARTLNVAYLPGNTGKREAVNGPENTGNKAEEKIRLSVGKGVDQALTGACLAGLTAEKKEHSLNLWLKGLNQASLTQGGQFSAQLKDGIDFYPDRKALQLRGLRMGWQPADVQASRIELSFQNIKVSPEALSFSLNSEFEGELKPQPLFANQSRRLELNLQMKAHADLNLPAYLTMPEQPLSLIQQAQVDVQQSHLLLKPAPGDDAVLWAPAQLELPLLHHKGRWSLELHNPKAESVRWTLMHQGQGESLMRHPKLKQNLRLPYKIDFEFAAPLITDSAEQLLAELEGAFNGQLIEPSSLIDTYASSPNSLIPALNIGLKLDSQRIRLVTDTQLELARLGEWMTLPSVAQITDGLTEIDARFSIPQQDLTGMILSGGDGWLSSLEGDAAVGLKHLTGQAKGYEFSGVSLPLKASVSGGQWQVNPTMLNVNRVFAGVELTDLKMDLKASGLLIDESMPLQAQVSEFSADTLGGSVHLAQLNYPFSKDETSDLMLDKLDLSQLIALSDKQIKVTGLLNGTLPLLLSDQGVTIRQGQVIGNNGEIILQDNPAWQAMLQQQPVLASQLKHLNHLHYDLLQGDIGMEANGQLTAVLTIKGENRAESQPVNLNFTSEQNILTLLKALRLSDQIDKSLSESAQRTYQ